MENQKTETSQPTAIVRLEDNIFSLEKTKNRIETVKRFVFETLKEGIDYGLIPGCGDKKVLFKPGAEKICLFFGLFPQYEGIKIVEDFDKPLFFYRYRCDLVHMPTGSVVCSGIGSANSYESKYRYRTANLICPHCKSEAILKSKWAEKEPQKAWYCYKKKGGCGAQFQLNDPKIVNQKSGQVENEKIFDQVNTLDKMAQKRALMAGVLIIAGLSEYFTQDIEDFEHPQNPAPPPEKKTGSGQHSPVNREPAPSGGGATPETIEGEFEPVPEKTYTDPEREKVKAELRRVIQEIHIKNKMSMDHICKELLGPKALYFHIEEIKSDAKTALLETATEKGKVWLESLKKGVAANE